jgi:hypothetical protein
MQTLIKVNGQLFEQTDQYERDGAKVTHFVILKKDGSLGALALNQRTKKEGDRAFEAWWFWYRGGPIECGYESPEGALAGGLAALTQERDRLTEILEGWT